MALVFSFHAFKKIEAGGRFFGTVFYFSWLSKIEAGGRFFFFSLMSIQCQEMRHIHTQYSRNIGTGITVCVLCC